MLRRFYCPQLTESSSCAIDAREAAHARRVLRFKAGEEAELFDGKGHRARARFTALTEKRAALNRSEIRTSPPPEPRLHLAQAVPHRHKIEQIAEQAEELGLEKLILLRSARTVFDFNKSSFGRLIQRLRTLALESAKQSRNDYLMEVEESWRSPQELAAGFPEYSRVFLTAPGASFEPDPFRGLASRPDRPLLILIGPEGGFSPEEEKLFLDAGALPLNLGDILLKCDTAAAASLSVVKYAFYQRFGTGR
jgi:16S rRNA (uracil1498-N3)-methyltransferase